MPNDPMPAGEFLAALDAIGYPSPRQAALHLGLSERDFRHFAQGDKRYTVYPALAVLLEVLVGKGMTADDIDAARAKYRAMQR